MRPLRIASLYRISSIDETPEIDAAVIWWKRVAEGLAARGHHVDLVAGRGGGPKPLGQRLRAIHYPAARWDDYDVILTFFHKGFANLLEYGAHDHPGIVSSLGSVVGSNDDVPGMYFFGEYRKWLLDIQERVAERASAVIILTDESRELWIEQHGRSEDVEVIPQGVDRHIPPPGRTPFGAYSEKIVVYLGNIYRETQKEMNLIWQERLNRLGRELRKRGMRLCHIGSGDTEMLDPDAVTHLPPVEYGAAIWDCQYFASAGVILAQGEVQHNESTKLYHYLRAGLPVVSEAPVPNNHVLEAAGLGFIAPYGDNPRLAELLAEAATRPWNRTRAVDYIVRRHSWDLRIKRYEELCYSRSALVSAGSRNGPLAY
jgi:glycosyltransferase involved in cell wall biosynthesis